MANTPNEAQAIINKFNDSGLLVRTAQLNNAHLEFQDAGAPASEFSGVKEKRYGPKRNWSLIHNRLIAGPYKMVSTAEEEEELKDLQAKGPAGKALLDKKFRSIGLLAAPDAIGNDRFLKFSEADLSSSATMTGQEKTFSPDQFKSQMEGLRNTLLQKQKDYKGRLDNSEIQTVGFNTDAVKALLFKPGGFKDWAEAKPKFQEVVKKITTTNDLPGFTPSTLKEIQIFTYKINETEKTTTLEYLDTLKA